MGLFKWQLEFELEEKVWPLGTEAVAESEPFKMLDQT